MVIGRLFRLSAIWFWAGLVMLYDYSTHNWTVLFKLDIPFTIALTAAILFFCRPARRMG
jgi:hypothetical protein